MKRDRSLARLTAQPTRRASHRIADDDLDISDLVALRTQGVIRLRADTCGLLHDPRWPTTGNCSLGTYTVKIYSTGGNLQATSQPQTLVQDQFIGLDFTGLNPADPVIYGFVMDANAAGVAGATVNLYNVAGKLVATVTTSASRHYSFSFSAPGSYTVAVTPPAGYAAQAPVTLSLKQFDDVRVDFTLSKK